MSLTIDGPVVVSGGLSTATLACAPGQVCFMNDKTSESSVVK